LSSAACPLRADVVERVIGCDGADSSRCLQAGLALPGGVEQAGLAADAGGVDRLSAPEGAVQRD
jgi:hypothetical protein